MSDRKSWEGYLPVTAAMFGDFRFEAGPSSITGKLNGSRKMSSLLAYLMLHPSTNVPVSELLEILWPDNERDDPANALKTLVYRVRSMLKEDGFPYYRECFIVKNGTYRWNPEITCVIDAVEFEQLCKAALPKDNADSEKELLLKKAVGLYKGEFLPKCASEEWVIPLSAYYQSLYLRSVLALCEILKERKRYGEVSDYCRKALILEPLEEELEPEPELELPAFTGCRNGWRRAATSGFTLFCSP